IYIVFIVASIFAFLVSLFFAIKIPWKESRGAEGEIINWNEMKKSGKLFAIVISYALLLFIFGMTKSIMVNFLSFDNASNVFNWLYWLLWAGIWPLMVTSLIIGIINLLTGKKMREAFNRGVPFR
ncbi:hypothetical protein LCGC14_1746450, partial [marine sediment metagenome]